MTTAFSADVFAGLPAVGEEFGGGYLGALMPAADGRFWALIVSPKMEGEMKSVPWGMLNKPVPAARSFTDGLANSDATNDEHHPAALFCRAIHIGGMKDWYLPSSAELAALWVSLGPGHTFAEAFRRGGREAFDESWYWSSTEVKGDPSFAWGQPFGDQPFGLSLRNNDDKYGVNMCRAIRRVHL